MESKIINCHINPRNGETILHWHNGHCTVNLDGYAIIPLEQLTESQNAALGRNPDSNKEQHGKS
jgi:hypothetical protein